jgi:hypothetical protein
MPEPTFSMTAEDDDLPRTIRRERYARERQAREREAQSPVSVPSIDHDGAYGALASPPATVTAIDMPFLGLMTFFIKAVFAAVPAVIMLTALLWLFGQGLQSFFPQLLKMKIDVQIYAPQSAADFRDKASVGLAPRR